MAKLKKQKTKAKAQKPASKKAAAPKAKKASTKPAKAAAVKKSASKPAMKKPAAKSQVKNQKPAAPAKKAAPVKLTPFLAKQKDRLLQLRDGMLDSMNGVARDSLRSRAEGSEASAFGMHQADAGSDAYDRDFALSLLSQEQDALYEIDEALKRIDLGTYGTCEMSAKPIPHARLEAIPFARYTVDCQSQLEKQNKLMRVRQPVTSLFGLTDDEGGGDGDEEEVTVESKD
jgi:RNA polymerase-binding transcription factor DksA